MKTNELLYEWLEQYEKTRVKSRTYSRYRSLIDLHISPALGDVEITALNRKQIQEFLTQKKKEGNMRNGETMSSSSTNLMLTVLNMAFEYGIDMEICKNNPCLRLKRSPDDCKKVEAFTIDEQRKITVCPCAVPCPVGIRDDRTAARAKHEACGREDHQKRHDEIDRLEGNIPRKIGNEKAVHHTVNGSEDHH